MQPIVELDKVEKHYSLGEVDLHVLKGINLKINKGEFLAIQGPSGSGKSTIMHIAGCLDRPTKGRVIINKEIISELDDNELAVVRRNEIGFVFQFFYLVPSLTVLGNVKLPMTFAGNADEKRAVQLLKMVGLGNRMNHYPNQISGGEQQRVAIARALINSPKIIMADEPTGNLDSKSGEAILKLLMDLNKKGITLIMVTHDNKIASKADRVIHLKDGKIIKEVKRR